MAKYEFTRKDFSPKPEDGNLSLSTLKKRIYEALECLTNPDDYIVLEDGTQCHNETELFNALELNVDVECPHCKKTSTLESEQ